MYVSEKYIKEMSSAEVASDIAGGTGLGVTVGALLGAAGGAVIGLTTKMEMNKQLRFLEDELKNETHKKTRDDIIAQINAIKRQLKLGVIKQSAWKGYIRGAASGAIVGGVYTGYKVSH